jgi:hypothetical protein
MEWLFQWVPHVHVIALYIVKGVRLKSSMQAQCQKCSQKLRLNRIENHGVVEFQAECAKCGWSAIFRELRCGGCHGRRLFEWVRGAWRCLTCGRTRNSSPPKQLAVRTENTQRAVRETKNYLLTLNPR